MAWWWITVSLSAKPEYHESQKMRCIVSVAFCVSIKSQWRFKTAHSQFSHCIRFADSVVRTHFYKYFHPKEALIANGVLNRWFYGKNVFWKNWRNLVECHFVSQLWKDCPQIHVSDFLISEQLVRRLASIYLTLMATARMLSEFSFLNTRVCGDLWCSSVCSLLCWMEKGWLLQVLFLAVFSEHWHSCILLVQRWMWWNLPFRCWELAVCRFPWTGPCALCIRAG